jgi:CheY-like chemotaxis protein
MPVMDGFEATRQIRRQESDARRTPIIALTATAMASDQEACTESGMDDFLSKPCSQADLQRTLHRWMPQEDRTATA